MDEGGSYKGGVKSCVSALLTNGKRVTLIGITEKAVIFDVAFELAVKPELTVRADLSAERVLLSYRLVSMSRQKANHTRWSDLRENRDLYRELEQVD